MDSIIRTVQSKTETLLKNEAKSWLDSHPSGVEKASVYLVPTLVGLLSKRINSREESREAIAFFEEENMEIEWADQPDILLELFRRGDGAIPEKVKTVYQFIVAEEHPLVIRQLSSTGDLNPQHLDKVLAFLSAITAAQVLKTLASESQKGRKLLSILKEEAEYIKIQTPSKLLQLIKEEEGDAELTKDTSERDKEEPLERPSAPLRALLIYSFLMIASLAVLYWIKSPEMDELSRMVQWNANEEKQLPDQKIWQIGRSIELTLDQEDPLNDFVCYFLQAKNLDTLRNFHLNAVSAVRKDSLLPEYYKETLEHLQLLQKAQPHPPFHLSISLTPGENAIISQEMVDHLKSTIFNYIPVLEEGSPYSFLIKINKPQIAIRNRNATDPKKIKVEWSLSLDRQAFSQ